MIKTWTLEHFKSAYRNTTLAMSPLTVFAGANSSGKSTLIQSILLVAQTLQSTVSARPLVLNGHIVKLGTFQDVLTNDCGSDTIRMGFELEPTVDELRQLATLPRRYSGHGIEMLGNIGCTFAFSSRGLESDEATKPQPCLEESVVKVTASTDTRSIQEEIQIRRSSKPIAERLRDLQLTEKSAETRLSLSLEYEVVRQSNLRGVRRYFRVPSGGKPVGALVQHFLPARISVVYDEVEDQAKGLVDAFTGLDEARYRDVDLALDEQAVLAPEFSRIIMQTIREFASGLSPHDRARDRFERAAEELEQDFRYSRIARCIGALPINDRRLLRQRFVEKYDELMAAARSDREPDYRLAYVPLSELTDPAVDYIQNFFEYMLKYLGPLRDEPKPVYPLSGAVDSKDIGFRGEHTAAVLHEHRNTMVEYVPSSQFASKRVVFRADSRHVKLEQAVLDWLDYVGVAKYYETIDRDKLGHELKVAVTSADSLHDLTHVGVGVSQVLPILVRSLLAERGSALIFEQPELHLHPRVQSRLADFFVSMIMLNKQCIVETHSEYLINRLRYLSAISSDEQISKSVLIYFVEKTAKHSSYRPVYINEFGVIEDWPKGFFDEREDMAADILKAGLNKRKTGGQGPHA